jgi:hypothetical protein
MLIEKEMPQILNSVYTMCHNNNLRYGDIDDLFNDWIMQFISRDLPSRAYISAITNSVEADEICKAIEKDERFNVYIRE